MALGTRKNLLETAEQFEHGHCLYKELAIGWISIETLSVDPLEGQFKVQLCSLVGPLVGPNSNRYMLVLNEISF